MTTILGHAIFGAALLAAGAASAADAEVAAPKAMPAPLPMYSWGGAYLGLQAGYDTNRATATATFSGTESGAIAGIYTGYNFVLSPSVVAGVDFSINYDWARAAGSTGPDWKGLARGRVGFALDKFLIYGSGGAAFVHYNATAGGGTGSASDWGWTIGGGGEMALSSHLTGRIDYSFQDYGTFTLSGTAPVNGTAVNLKSHSVTLGIGFKY